MGVGLGFRVLGFGRFEFKSSFPGSFSVWLRPQRRRVGGFSRFFELIEALWYMEHPGGNKLCIAFRVQGVTVMPYGFWVITYGFVAFGVTGRP